ncbi:putative rRNA processing protein [Rosellinia necatrix]|uniref:rRNA biogenesis protein RRP36 n=1 Tax=Rosellinia necatrix TaxID=77044 RepID=A0A1S7UM06_ROSNE|nr:putative rRNA processing protein [Rosellinia necatrix]
MPPTASHKHKIPFGGLQRRVRPRREELEPEPEEYSEDSEEGSEDGSLDGMSEGEERTSDESDSASGSEDENEDEDEDDREDPASEVAQVSFGALAKAQASMPSIRQKKGRKGANDKPEGDDRDRERHRARHDDDDRHDSRAAKPPAKRPKPQRSSKHAPAEMSSKRQVTRRREVISVAPRAAARDPRFSAASGPVDEARARAAYAFLDTYREAEMAELRAAAKTAKSAPEREVVARHRREEKALVAQGKRPFYLKKSEQKRRALVDRFAGMKKKQVDRAIERRRKKLTSRERREMPTARRDAA